MMVKTLASGRHTDFDVATVRCDFPLLDQQLDGCQLIYLDNAATSQKPNTVIASLEEYYRKDNSNVHRGVHTLSERATADYEQARIRIKNFIHAKCMQEIIFVRGTTEAINLVAQSYARSTLNHGDEVIISTMEHHSNIVPWQIVCQQTGAVLKIIPIDNDGNLIMREYEKLLNSRTKIVSIVHISNALGKVNPIKTIINRAHDVGAVVMIDGAQAAAHMTIDVQALDCDFYAFSGHKLFGPTGIGVLYGKQDLLEEMPPWQGGGDMIRKVSFEETLYNDLPYKFEAGTPHIAGAIGLGAAVDYINAIGLPAITSYERQLFNYATVEIKRVKNLRLIGSSENKTSILSFIIDGIHPHDIGTILDHEGIAIRAGHHCTMPIMNHFNLSSTARASFSFYNTFEEVDRLVVALAKAREVFA